MALRQCASRFVAQLGLLRAEPAFARAYAAKVAEGFKYAESHEWLQVNESGDTATIGISDHAQEKLGDLVYVELPDVGSSVTKGEAFGVVESVKASSDVYAPVSGEVLERNEELISDPALVNADPFGSWFLKIKISDPTEQESLHGPEAYTKLVE